MSRLFRQEAINHQRQRLFGDVMLLQPVSHYVLSIGAVSLVFAVFAFIAIGEYARKAKVSGYLSPDKGVIKIYAPRAGVLTHVHAERGQWVEKDQPLFTIHVAQNLEQGGDIDGYLLDEIKLQQATLQNRMTQVKERFAAEQGRLTSRLEGHEKNIQLLREQENNQRRRLELADKQNQTLSELAAQGHIARIDQQQSEAAWLDQRQSLNTIRSRLADLANAVNETRSQLQQIPLEKAEQLAQLYIQLSNLQQQRAEVVGRRTSVIRAPTAGSIATLQITEGGTAQPGLPLLALLPADSQLQAHLFIPTRSIGFIESGQSVNVRYQAFPYQRYGIYPGSVNSISKTILTPNELPVPLPLQEPVYRVIVDMHGQMVSGYGRQWPLQAGMLLDADIVLERRSLLDWLLDPLYSLRGKL